ncbi:MAG: hypothetical protein JNG88_10965 [Phycisphaerales bacterium]|nr:hypothetical protein [Phycisphaerales bacterium]
MRVNWLRRFAAPVLLGGSVFGTTIRCNDSDFSFIPGFDRVVVVDEYYYDDDCCDDDWFDFFWDDDD